MNETILLGFPGFPRAPPQSPNKILSILRNSGKGTGSSELVTLFRAAAYCREIGNIGAHCIVRQGFKFGSRLESLTRLTALGAVNLSKHSNPDQDASAPECILRHPKDLRTL